jgi:hypothetical protein
VVGEKLIRRGSTAPASPLALLRSIGLISLITLLTVGGSVSRAASLPDGRAYEQASPVDKNGASAEGGTNLVQAAPNGAAVTFYSESTFPGAEGAQDFGSYLSTRGAEQWNTQGLLPPANLGIEGRVRARSEDLKFAYVTTGGTNGEEPSFFQRDNATRALTFIAPLGQPVVVATSADDTKVLIEAERKLVSGAAEGHNLYLWDSTTGTIHLAGALNLNNGSAPSEGVVAGPYAWLAENTFGGGSTSNYFTPNALAPDASAVYFTTLGTGPESGEIFVRKNPLAEQSPLNGAGECMNLELACTTEVSASQRSVLDTENRPAAFLYATTGDSSDVLFLSSEKLTNDATTGSADEGKDLYRYDTASETLTDLVPVGPSSGVPNGAEVRGLVGVSADGSRVYFVANGILGDGASRGATAGNCHPEGLEGRELGECNLYLWQAGAGITYVARLSAEAPLSEGAAEISDNEDWVPRSGQGIETKVARVSNDGNTLVFRSQLNQTAYESSGVPEFYRYRADRGTIDCLSCPPQGSAPIGAASLANFTPFAGPAGAAVTPVLTRNLSSDGKRFIFQTPAKLVPQDINGNNGCPTALAGGGNALSCQDIYEWEEEGTGSCPSFGAGCLYLISAGTSPEPSFYGDSDPSGNNIFFLTGSQLVGQDRDQAFDVYDARAGGGLAAQNPVLGVSCSDLVTCRPPGQAPSTSPIPGTVAHVGPGSVRKVRCGKKLRRVTHHGKLRCIARNNRGRPKPRASESTRKTGKSK